MAKKTTSRKKATRKKATRKKPARKKATRKKTSQNTTTNQQQFTDSDGSAWDHADIPAVVKKAASRYQDACVKASKASAKKASEKESVKELMKKHGVKRVPVMVDGVKKFLVADPDTKLSLKPIKDTDKKDTKK